MENRLLRIEKGIISSYIFLKIARLILSSLLYHIEYWNAKEKVRFFIVDLAGLILQAYPGPI